MRLQKKDVWKSTKNKRERLKGAFIEQKGDEWTSWKEDELGCRWEQEIVLEGSEYGEWEKSGGLQQNKGWKWEAGTKRK